jgi:hypothetical protein
MEYEHRNGESEPPDIEGYYFFEGRKLRHRKGVKLGVFMRVWRNDDGVMRHYWMYPGTVDELIGRWWGPVTPPWRES